MNNNTIAIERFLQGEMDATEKNAFELQLANDKELQLELQLQQQMIQAIQDAGLKGDFAKAIRKKIWINKVTKWVCIVALVATGLFLYTFKDPILHSFSSNHIDIGTTERFDINTNADTIIETKDGVIFAIPAHAFNTAKSIIQIEVKTALNAYDIMRQGLSTVSNGALLQTAGMFYINGFADSKLLALNKQIAVSIPTNNITEGMQLFDGKEDENDQVNWVNPKPIANSLRTYDITTLDFYPPKYLPTLKALGKDYTNKKYTDSLYYSFSGYALVQPDDLSEPTEVWEGGDSVATQTDTLASNLLFIHYKIDPSVIHSIWDNAYSNTNLATKEFEERLRYMHNICEDKYLEIYLHCLDKPLHIADSFCALIATGEDKKQFQKFAARKDGGAMITNALQQKLSLYFQQKYAGYKSAAEKTWQKYQKVADSFNAIVDTKRKAQAVNDFTRENKNFQEELNINLVEAYRQIGVKYTYPPARQYYNVNITTTGWKNLDMYVIDATATRKSMSYTDSTTGKTAVLTYKDIKINIADIAQYDRVLVYLIPDSLSSFQKINGAGNVFKESLNMLFRYDVVAIGYKGTSTYFIRQKNAQPQTYQLTLKPMTEATLSIALSEYSLSKNNAFRDELDYQLFEQQEAERQAVIQKNVEFSDQIAAAIFSCIQFEWE